MPGGDGTGPRGLGPMTGGGRGFCVVPVSEGESPFSGRQFRGGFRGRGGRGRGYRHCFYATGLPGWARAGYSYPQDVQGNNKSDLTVLKEEAAMLKRDLEDVQGRINSMESNQLPNQK
ncbi:MAG: hypothetical protein A2297_08095 [Elusimicrobia bacterium RIFOXYB2_FULL_48_7]|nr:MAG: hypothetical protein A2297_08095 [Elusimicrobia bacterium RIFOXYB2_FULL_48_7]